MLWEAKECWQQLVLLLHPSCAMHCPSRPQVEAGALEDSPKHAALQRLLAGIGALAPVSECCCRCFCCVLCLRSTAGCPLLS